MYTKIPHSLFFFSFFVGRGGGAGVGHDVYISYLLESSLTPTGHVKVGMDSTK